MDSINVTNELIEWQKAVVTVSHRGDGQNIALAKQTAEALDLPFALRGNLSLKKIAAEHAARFVVVAKDNLLHIVDTKTEAELFFHPNMAHTRLKNLRLGLGCDRMAAAMGLKEGMSVLDCTLGLGSDAIVAAHVVGDNGSVTALEGNPLLAYMMKHALANFSTNNEPLKAAMRRIKVICAEHDEFLRNATDKSYDIVYFDPMFRHPLKKSSAMNALRPFSLAGALRARTIDEAKRVARRRVVLKEGMGSGEFARLGFEPATGGRYSKVGYGTIGVGVAVG